MKIEAVVAQVTTRKATGKNGQPISYYSAFVLDTEANPLLRYPGQLEFRPSEDDIKENNICEGAEFTIHILNVIEVRNGVPVIQPKLVKKETKLPEKPTK